MSNSLRSDFQGQAPAALPLNQANLDAIAREGRLATPGFNLEDRTASIMHFAPGNFSAGHLCVYAHELMEKGHLDCGIIAVSPRLKQDESGRFPAIERRDELASQDFLYTVIERDRTSENARVIASLMDIMIGPDDRRAVYEKMADPAIRLVTATVTQKGYEYKADDIDQFANYLVEGLALRRERGLAPFAVMSCDNIPNNSSQLKSLVLAYAAMKDKGLGHWIAENVSFYDTMVDRIVPKISEASRYYATTQYGVIDNCVIATEPYKELVIGVKPGNEPPVPFDEVGATYSENVSDHELAKLTMLNGSHMYIGCVGRNAGERYIEEALDKPELLARMQRFMNEVQQTLPMIPSRDYDVYGPALVERFRNPHPHDELQRLARTGVDKIGTRLIDPLVRAYQENKPHREIVFGIVNYIAYLKSANDDPSIGHDTENGFFIEDQKAYDQGYVSIAKSLNGDLTPIFSLPHFSALANNAQYGQRFQQEMQSAWTALKKEGQAPATATALNANSADGRTPPSP